MSADTTVYNGSETLFAVTSLWNMIVVNLDSMQEIHRSKMDFQPSKLRAFKEMPDTVFVAVRTNQGF